MRISLFVFFLIVLPDLIGQDIRATDLKYHWFQKEAEAASPVIGEISGNEIYFFTSFSENKFEEIQICNEDDFSVWVNNQLVYAKEKPGCIQFLPEELKVYALEDTLYFRVSSSNLASLSTNLITNKAVEEDILQFRDKRIWLSDFKMLFMLTMLILTAIYRQGFNSKFRRALRNPFNFKIRGTVAKDMYTKFISFDNLYALIFLSLSLAGLLIIINTELGLYSVNQEGLSSTILFWLFASVIFFVFCVVKYILASILSQIFNLRAFPNIQVQDYIHFMTFTSGITFVLVFLDFAFVAVASDIFLDSARTVVIIATVFFQLWFYLKFVKYYSHRKLLIISYLCTTEFLPGFIAAYWLLN